MARALEDLPRLREALGRGERPWSAVRELTRVATAATEREWVAESERLTVREVEALVAGRRLGDRPADARDPVITPRRVSFELAPEDYVIVQDALEKARLEVGPAAANGAALVAMAQAFLGARPVEAAAYRTTVTVCAHCERTWQPVGAELIEVRGEVGACARCDGEVEGVALDGDATHGGRDGDDTRSAGAGATHGGRDARSDGATHGGHDALSTRATHGGRDGDDAQAFAGGDAEASANDLAHRAPDAVRPRARQLLALASRVLGVPMLTLTPRMRAAVRARDRHRCAVPGCRNFRFVDLHHRQPRAAGGAHVLDNLISLCTAHHRAVHEGTLAIEGTAASGLRFMHAGGTLYGSRAP